MDELVGDGAMVTLSDGRVTLRPWRRGDARFLASSSADPAIVQYNGAHDRQGRPAPPPSVADAERIIDEFALKWRTFHETGVPDGVAFAIADARRERLVGCCGVDSWNSEDVAQIGYWVAADARGHGFATLAAIHMTQWLFERGAARVLLTVLAGNEASAAVARRAGFAYEGTMRAHSVWQGERCDVLWFAALPSEWTAPGADRWDQRTDGAGERIRRT